MTHTIAQLWRYPVKSMQGEMLTHATVDPSGIAGDRRFGVITPDGFVLSAKSEPRLLQASARVRQGATADVIDIELPSGVRTASDDTDVDALLSAWLDRPVQLHHASSNEQFLIHHELDVEDPSKTMDFSTPPGAYYDSRSTLHLLSDAALAAARALYPAGQWEARRFRPNVVVAADGDGFVEEAWVGATIQIGEVPALVRSVTERCVVTTRAQPGLDRDLDVYRTLRRHNEANLGIYLIPQGAGTVTAGDPVIP